MGIGLADVVFRMYVDVSGNDMADPRVWTEVSHWVMTHADFDGQPMNLAWGRSDSISDITPSQLTSVLFDNLDGRFTSGLTSSPYYPNFGKSTPLKLTAEMPYTGALTLTDDGLDEYIVTAATGIIDIGDETFDITVGTWTDLGDELWDVDETLTTIGLFNGFIDSAVPSYTSDSRLPIVEVSCSDMLARTASMAQLRSLLHEEILVDNPDGFYPLDDPGPTAGDIAGSRPPVGAVGAVEWQAATPAADQDIQGIYLGGTGQALKWLVPQPITGMFEMFVSTNSDAAFQPFTASGGNTTLVDYGDGQPHQIVIDDTGAVSVDGGAFAGSVGKSVAALGVNFLGTIWCCAFYPTALSSARLAQHREAVLTGFAGEGTAAHLARLAGYRPNYGSRADTCQGAMGIHDTATQTYQSGLLDVGAAEGGALYADGDGILTLRSRSRMFNPVPVVTVNAVSPTTQFSSDSAFEVNDVTITPPDGANIRFFDKTAVDNHGSSGTTLDLVIDTDAHALNMAQWLVGVGTRDMTAAPQLDVNLLAEANPAIVASVLQLAAMDVVAVGTPPSVAPSEPSWMVQGGEMTLGVTQIDVSLFATALPPLVVVIDGDTAHGVGSSAVVAY